jgi:hypothetical protein
MQHLVLAEIMLVVDSDVADPDDVAANFAARLSELAASEAHLLDYMAQAHPLPAPSASPNQRV